MSDDGTLSAKLRRTAESVGVRGGHLVPLSYGSAAGELAICMSGVGLIDREDLRVLSVRAEATAIDRITGAHFARRLQPGQAMTAATVHWARTAADEAILVSPAGPALLLLEELGRESDGGSVEVEELTLTAIGIVGPATPRLLMDLGAYGALAGCNGTGTVAVTALGATSATWLLLDEACAIALVEAEQALAAWELICAAGRRYGLGYVGAEAAERYELVRSQKREPALG